VTDAHTGAPIGSATLKVVGSSTQTVFTDSTGHYSLRLPVGTYGLAASGFGYFHHTMNGVVVRQGASTTKNIALTKQPAYRVAGNIRDPLGKPLVGAVVRIADTPIPPATTDGTGAYTFASVPEGTYNLQAGEGCYDTVRQPLVVDGNESLNIVLSRRHDAFGYGCEIIPAAYVEANKVLALSGDDDVVTVHLPFPFTLYGQKYKTVYVGTNGMLNFVEPNADPANGRLPSALPPNGSIYPYWDNLVVDAEASVRSRLLGAAPNRQFVIEWRNVAFFGDPARRVDFEVVLHENGQILMQYRNIANHLREQGVSATFGLENHENFTGTIGVEYGFNQPVVYDGLAVRYQLRSPRSNAYLPTIMQRR
jgi:hypothetical protein